MVAVIIHATLADVHWSVSSNSHSPASSGMKAPIIAIMTSEAIRIIHLFFTFIVLLVFAVYFVLLVFVVYFVFFVFVVYLVNLVSLCKVKAVCSLLCA